MSATADTSRDVERAGGVTPLELFFDLVFVFAITQVTVLLAGDPTWRGLLNGLLVLGALWWAWAAYAWLTNTVNPDDGATRIVMLAAMAAMLVAAVAVPQAFGSEGVLFGCHGAVCGGSNIAPRLYVDLYEAARRTDLPAVRELQGRVMRLSGALYTVGAASSSYLRGLKCSLAQLGVCGDYLAAPLQPLAGAERRLIAERLRELGLETAATVG